MKVSEDFKDFDDRSNLSPARGVSISIILSLVIIASIADIVRMFFF